MIDIHALAERRKQQMQGVEKKGSSSSQESNPFSLRQQVLEALKRRGPSVPVKIAEAVGRESMFVGAVLSELLQLKEIKLTHAKMGGSRVYYVPGQEEKLSILYPHLKEMERKAYDVIKEKQVVKADQVEPAIRVALGDLKDFAVLQGDQEGMDRVWHWHLYDPSKVETKPKVIEQKEVIKPKAVQEEILPKKEAVQVKTPAKEKQTAIPKPEVKKKVVKDDTFSIQIDQYLFTQEMQVLSKDIVRKNGEVNYTAQLPSKVGNLEVFVCARNKKKINEQDLILAHQKGQHQKMITLFITPGEVTKKAKEYLEKNIKGYLILKQIKN